MIKDPTGRSYPKSFADLRDRWGVTLLANGRGKEIVYLFLPIGERNEHEARLLKVFLVVNGDSIRGQKLIDFLGFIFMPAYLWAAGDPGAAAHQESIFAHSLVGAKDDPFDFLDPVRIEKAQLLPGLRLGQER